MPEVQTITNTVPFDDILKSLTQASEDTSSKKDFFDMTETPFDVSTVLNDEQTDTVIDEVKPDNEDKTDPIVETKVTPVSDPNKVVADIIQNNTSIADGDPVNIDGDSINKLYLELIKDELMEGFDDDKPVTTVKELRLLIDENKKKIRQQVISEELPQFVDSLPEDVQAIVKYATDGGTDLKGMYKALAEVEEFRQTEVKEADTRGQEDIAYKYLKATGYAKGNDEDIREQVEEWKDNKTLFKRSKKFKVELDEMHEQLVGQKLQEQEQRAKFELQRHEQQKSEIYNAVIKDNDINGIKIDKQTQNKIYAGLTNKAWDAEDGRKVDMLDALIDFYKFKQPNPKLLAEALYLLSEPDAYREKRDAQAKVKVNSDNLRTIRTEQSRRATTNVAETQNKGIKRTPANNNFWK